MAQKVIEMEAYRVFIPKYRDDLVLCASLLKKAIDREHLRLDERLKLARENEEKEEQRAIVRTMSIIFSSFNVFSLISRQ